ncbi:sel1 repeat family protein [Phyllobacterium sp. 628]|uniref:tetratricopeptide repeat protein n=1 Tax=Phyllobacterium sp. 628 TaxID=2718938 RepID=UPI0016623A6A|nr:tetratricopeptide repeat protein [Phyllobacterium sp. 628]QND50878.1 sel1 repeat family protein [Phyllobacterium sp. 628]
MGAKSGKLLCTVAAVLAAFPVLTWEASAQTPPAATETPSPAAPVPAAAAPEAPVVNHAPALTAAPTDAPQQLETPQTTPKQDKPKLASDPAADIVNPTRFGKGAIDDAFGAYQRGLYITAYNLALPRAEAGDGAAQVLIADMQARGLGIPVNLADSAKWYGKAAEQGVPEAQFRYGTILLQGKYAPRDPQKAKVLMKAAADSGNAMAQFNYAQILMQEHPGAVGIDSAYPWFEKAAGQGLADGEYALSQILANGTLTIPRDDTKAREFLIKAAKKGYDTAQLDLGRWFVEGRGGPRDYTSGFGWTLRAAAGGNVAAQAQLAKLYYQGLGVEGDPIKAAAWYIIARRAGLSDHELDSFLDGLDDDQMKAALTEANKLR